MSQENNVYMIYIGSAIAIILVVIMVSQLYKSDVKVARKLDKNYSIYVDTPAGIVKSSDEDVHKELVDIQLELKKKIHVAENSNDDDLSQMISAAISNLEEFIKKNPKQNSLDLCTLDLRSNVMEQAMADTITPDEDSWMAKYKTIMEYDSIEEKIGRDPKSSLTYLLQNMNVTIALLRSRICNNGKLDISILRNILAKLNRNIKDKGRGYYESDTYKLNILHKYPKPSLPFSRDAYVLEPFSGKSLEREISPNIYKTKIHMNRTPKISKQLNDGKESMTGGIASISTDFMISHRPTFAELYPYSYPRLGNKEKQIYVIGEKDGKNEHIDIDIGGKVNIDMAIEDPEAERPGGNATYQYSGEKGCYGNESPCSYAHMYSKYKVADNTFEGLAEKDILGYKPPGHLIAQLHDKDDYYTVNVNSCLGKTATDSVLVSECVAEDMKGIDALNGDASGLLNCNGDCYDPVNYLRFYSKFPKMIQEKEIFDRIVNNY